MPFQKGQSGNPGGRPKVVAEVRSLAQSYTQEAVETLVAIMRSAEAPPAARAAAAGQILDRGHGKPAQAITGEDGGPVKWLLEWADRQRAD